MLMRNRRGELPRGEGRGGIAMKKMLIGTLILVLVAGCATPQRYVVDVAKTEGCEDFDWNGRVAVTMTWKGIFGGGTTVDLI
jgi:hypothetical protein